MITNMVKISTAAELQDGSKKKISLNGHEILFARAGGNYYAIDNKCPHLGGDLSLGKLEGTIITCPRHGSQFNITNGEVIKWTNWSGPVKALSQIIKSPHPVKTYKIKVENDTIYIEV
jgi:3-phenylpropionate/trans-cinnamate dioxygenase ferredoxin subunit